MEIRLYQTVYDEQSLKNKSPFCKPLVINNNRPYLFEYQGYEKMREDRLYKDCDYIGLFSPKFCQKTKISILDVLSWIEHNPGYDIYTFNPFPGYSYFFFNQWECGEFNHPGIKDLAQLIFKRFGFGDINQFPRMGVENVVYCNFWVGSSDFFKRYTGFLNEIVDYILTKPDLFLALTNHRSDNVPFFPFVIERLFNTYVYKSNKEFKVKPFLYPPNFYGSWIESVSLLRFETYYLHLNLIVDQINKLDEAYAHSDLQSEYRAEFKRINSEARKQVQDVIAGESGFSRLLKKLHRDI
ncbi:MAG: hypothetical protein AAFN93_17955 [Bacteroidota bacterium]